MDVPSGFIGNATDGIGQGLAYVLPNSRTESYAIQLNQEAAEQQRAQAALLAKQQQAANEVYQNHLYKETIPAHDAQWDKVIQDKYQQFTNDAAQYHATTGKDPFVNPDFINRRNDIMSMAANSKQAAEKAVRYSTILNNDKDNKLDPNDKQKIAQALVTYNADPVKNAGIFDGLTANARPYDVNDVLKDVTPVPLKTQNGNTTTIAPDTSAHLQQLRTVLTDPKFAPFLKKNGIDQGTFGSFGLPGPSGGTVYPTDPDSVNRIADHIITGAADPNNPAMATTLQHLGINPLDPSAKNKLVDVIARENQNTGHLMNTLGSAVDAKVKPERLYNPNYDLSAERLNLARERLEMAKNGTGGGGVPQDMNIPYNNGKANVNAQGYIPLSIPKKNFAGVPAYNLSDGKQVPALESSGDYSVVGVGNFPIIKGGLALSGNVAQPDFAKNHPNSVQQMPMVHVQKPKTADEDAQDFLIPYNKLPENIKNSKPVREALSNFRPANGQSSSTPAGTSLNNKHKKEASDYGL